MQSILDKFAAESSFRPGSPGELLALRIAQKLGDAKAAKAYATLADQYTEGKMLCAYRAAVRSADPANYWRHFKAAIQHGGSNGGNGLAYSLLAIRVERRAVAAAVFKGTHLDFADSIQLSSSFDKASFSAIKFLNWIVSQFDPESAALESIINGHEIQRRKLHDAIGDEVRRRGLPIWEVPKTAILGAFGQPPLSFRNELRSVIEGIWPMLSGNQSKPYIQDAAALGLHVQIERQFMH
jgi:hypothetical protein